MKQSLIILNHEKWHVCSKCGDCFDVRAEACQCPKCGHDLRKDI